MAVTPTYSFRYPVGSDDVDIPSDIYNLAADVESVLTGQFLKLSGGTLTGSLSGTSLSLSSTLSVTGTTTLTGATTLTGDLTISKSSPVFNITAAAATHTIVRLDSPAGYASDIALRTGTSNRWTFSKLNEAETGSDAGSNFVLYRYLDSGSYAEAIRITRASGLMTLTGDLTIGKASPVFTVSASSGNAYHVISAAASATAGTIFRSAGSTRWVVGKDETPDSSTATGSDFVVRAYDNNAALLSTPLSITRSTGAVTMSRIASPAALGDRISLYDDRNGLNTNHGFGVEASATYYKSTQYHRWYIAANADGGVSDMMQLDNQTLSLAHTTDSSSVSSGSIVTGGGIGIAKALYVGTTLNVAGAATFSNTVQSTGFLASAAAATSAGYQIYTGSSLRWNIRKENTAESGSDAGSDLVINRYNDSGVNQGVNFRIDRSTGLTTLTGDLTISKASALFTISAASGSPSANISGAAGTFRGLQFKTAGTRRWTMYANSDAESGSDVGSDFAMYRANDAGSETRVLYINRASGKTTFDAVGATAGLELGASGPRLMSGTGSPEGVVTAPVGSTWRDTAATTGAIRWVKASGTGNTGWVVEYGDTGQRNLAAVALENGWAVAYSVFLLRRTGSVVSLTIGATKTSATSDIIYTLPSGFRPPSSFYAVSSSATDDYANASVSSGGLLILSRTYMTVATHYLSLTYQTSDPWPSSLPGVAA